MFCETLYKLPERINYELFKCTSQKYGTEPYFSPPQTTAVPSEMALAPAMAPRAPPTMAVSAAAVVAVKCHCNVVAVDHKLDTGGGGGEGHNPRLYPGMGNGAEFGQGHGDDEDDDDKDSGNGSVLEFVPPSEFQVSFSLW